MKFLSSLVNKYFFLIDGHSFNPMKVKSKNLKLKKIPVKASAKCPSLKIKTRPCISLRFMGEEFSSKMWSQYRENRIQVVVGRVQ